MDSETPIFISSSILAEMHIPTARVPKTLTEEEISVCEARLKATWEKHHGGMVITVRPARKKAK